MRRIFTIFFSLMALGIMAQTTPAYIHAKFTQTKECMMLNETIVSKGVMEYEQPDKISWVYESGITAQLPPQMLAFIRKAVAGEFDTKKLPKQVKQLFSDVQIEMNEETNVAKRVILTEVNGDVTTIVFYDVETR